MAQSKGSQRTGKAWLTETGRPIYQEAWQRIHGCTAQNEEAAGIANVGHSTAKRFNKGARVHIDTAKKLCEAVELDWRDVTDNDLLVPTSIHLPTRLSTVPFKTNQYFTGREDILKNLHAAFTENNSVAINQTQAINGLGGIGKTQIARQYAYLYYDAKPFYDFVLWVTVGDTQEDIANSFAGLALKLNLADASSGQNKRITAVQEWLETHENWLLVFDNADTLEWLEPYLLSNSYKGNILITTRSNDMSKLDRLGIITPIIVKPMEPEDALDFLFRRIGRKPRNLDEQHSAEQLIKYLGYFPLALEQASAWVRNGRSSFTRYLQKFTKDGDETPNLEVFSENPAAPLYYQQIVTETWRHNFEVIEDEHKTSAELLKLSAVLSPDAIPYSLFILGGKYLTTSLASALKGSDSDDVETKIINLLIPLSNYSLITWEEDAEEYSIHRLVQTVINDFIRYYNSI